MWVASVSKLKGRSSSVAGNSFIASTNTKSAAVPAESAWAFVQKGAKSAESSGGIRRYKIVHVDDYPPPIGYELHMIAYDPKAPTFEEAAKLWKKKDGLKVALDHVHVQLTPFLQRDRRVLLVEPVTDEEMKPYLRSKR